MAANQPEPQPQPQDQEDIQNRPDPGLRPELIVGRKGEGNWFQVKLSDCRNLQSYSFRKYK